MSGSVIQRWTKPGIYDVEPGHWQKQLPGKHLKIAARGDVPGLERLLSDSGEFLNKRGSHGRTLLWEACRKGRLDAVDFLLSKGADHRLTGCFNSESHVQLDCYCAARFYRKPEVADRILAEGIVPPDIFRACFLGDRDRIEELALLNRRLLNEEDPQDENYHMPPIAFALVGEQPEVSRFLISAGVEIARYSSLLIFLIGLRNIPGFLAPLIAAGLDMRATDSSTFVASKSLSCLREILSRGAATDKPGHSGIPALVSLSRADKGKTLDRIELLLTHGADVNVAGPDGRTALHLAVGGGRGGVVSLLIRYGADPTLPDVNGDTAIEMAERSGDNAILSQLRLTAERA